MIFVLVGLMLLFLLFAMVPLVDALGSFYDLSYSL